MAMNKKVNGFIHRAKVQNTLFRNEKEQKILKFATVLMILLFNQWKLISGTLSNV